MTHLLELKLSDLVKLRRAFYYKRIHEIYMEALDQLISLKTDGVTEWDYTFLETNEEDKAAHHGLLLLAIEYEFLKIRKIKDL